jgi:hypothetical protein
MKRKLLYLPQLCSSTLFLNKDNLINPHSSRVVLTPILRSLSGLYWTPRNNNKTQTSCMYFHILFIYKDRKFMSRWLDLRIKLPTHNFLSLQDLFSLLFLFLGFWNFVDHKVGGNWTTSCFCFLFANFEIWCQKVTIYVINKVNWNWHKLLSFELWRV